MKEPTRLLFRCRLDSPNADGLFDISDLKKRGIFFGKQKSYEEGEPWLAIQQRKLSPNT
jgi:hypothetical protein